MTVGWDRSSRRWCYFCDCQLLHHGGSNMFLISSISYEHCAHPHSSPSSHPSALFFSCHLTTEAPSRKKKERSRDLQHLHLYLSTFSLVLARKNKSRVHSRIADNLLPSSLYAKNKRVDRVSLDLLLITTFSFPIPHRKRRNTSGQDKDWHHPLYYSVF